MKYIRTEYGKIYDVSGQWFDKEIGCYIDENSKATSTQNCKVADTIEDLCDEFVIKIKTGYLITYYDKTLLTEDANKNGADVYGAIWTEWGLKYVAKMNEKGVLELL